MKYIFVIPSYEPTDKLLEVTNKILEHDDIDLIVVNDGSDKSYDKFFNKLDSKVTLLSYDTNMGKGYALKYAFQYIKDNYKINYIVVTLDSDGQHDVDDAINLSRYVKEHMNTLALGMRVRGENVPLRSMLGNSITRLVFRLSSGVDIYDTQTGLRAFSNILMDDLLSIEGNRFEYEMNMLTFCAHNKIPMKEIKIKTIYENKNSGSHFKTIRDSYLIYKNIINFSFASFLSFIIDYILYSFTYFLSNNIIVSNVIARVISASFNFTLNRKYVFKSNKSLMSTVIKYIGLAVFILVVNTCLLKLLSFIIHPLIAKIFVELVMYIVSYNVQKRKIF